MACKVEPTAEPLIVTPFFDGRPGHEKQTRGILRALHELTAIRETPPRIVATSAGATAVDWLRYLLGLPTPPLPQQNIPHLLIGTGSRTHIPMLLTRRQTSGKVVTCMTPDYLVRNKIDLCFIPRHDQPMVAENVFVTFGSPNTAIDENRHEPDQGLILVGGIDTKSHRWDTAATMGQIETVIAGSQASRWTVSSSPRTPDSMIHRLDTFCKEKSNTAFFQASDTPPGWIEETYATHDAVWVTADSVSMVYEALTAGCRVGILPIHWKRKTNKFQLGIDLLRENRRVVTYEDWLTGASLGEARPLDEAGRCAAEILQRWWPKKHTDK